MKVSSINRKNRAIIFLKLFLLLPAINSFAQVKTSYSDKRFFYNLIIDSAASDDSSYFDCFIRSVTIIDKKTKDSIQTILVGENNFFCGSKNDSILFIEDENFDGHNDLRLIVSCGTGPNCSFYHWIYNSSAKRFIRNRSLEKIVNPEFIKTSKQIFSTWRSSLYSRGSSTYKYMNGKPVLIHDFEITFGEGIETTVERKLVNGKMRVISKKTEKVTDE